jgi:hypothetical protein
MFILSSEFDKAMIYLVRSITKNFMKEHENRSFNEIPINVSIIADADTID